jgi:hypothetical protein
MGFLFKDMLSLGATYELLNKYYSNIILSRLMRMNEVSLRATVSGLIEDTYALYREMPVHGVRAAITIMRLNIELFRLYGKWELADRYEEQMKGTLRIMFDDYPEADA